MLKIVIVVLLVAVLLSLGAAMFYMVRDRGQSNRPVKALTLRIGLSLALFALLFVGYFTGALTPHGIYPPAPMGAGADPAQSQ